MKRCARSKHSPAMDAFRDRFRGLAGLAVLPVPGPFDEAILPLVAALLFAFYRDAMRDAWRGTESERIADRNVVPS